MTKEQYYKKLRKQIQELYSELNVEILVRGCPLRILQSLRIGPKRRKDILSEHSDLSAENFSSWIIKAKKAGLVSGHSVNGRSNRGMIGMIWCLTYAGKLLLDEMSEEGSLEKLVDTNSV